MSSVRLCWLLDEGGGNQITNQIRITMSNIIKIFVESRSEVLDALLVGDGCMAHDPNGFASLTFNKNEYTPIRPLHEILKEAEETGGTVQYYADIFGNWQNGLNELDSIYRIKPTPQKPKLRAYTFDEAVEVFTQNAWIKSKFNGAVIQVCSIYDKNVFISGDISNSYEQLLEDYTHLNDNPCGVEEGGDAQ